MILGYVLNDTGRRRTEMLPSILQHLLSYFHFGTFIISRVVLALENIKASRKPNVPKKKNIKEQKNCEDYVLRVINTYKTNAWQNNKKVIKLMAKLCELENIKFGIVSFAYEPQLRGICTNYPQKIIYDFCSDNGIPFLNLLEVFRNNGDLQKLYLQGDFSHLSKLGHQKTGAAIRNWILSDHDLKGIFHARFLK